MAHVAAEGVQLPAQSLYPYSSPLHRRNDNYFKALKMNYLEYEPALVVRSCKVVIVSQLTFSFLVWLSRKNAILVVSGPQSAKL